MGGGNYSKNWEPNRNTSHYSSKNIHFTSCIPNTKNNILSLEDLIQKYALSNVHSGNYSIDSIQEINEFFKLVEQLLTSFSKIDHAQAQLLQNECQKIKSLYRRSRTFLINIVYSNSFSQPRIPAFSLNTDFDSPLKIKLANFISWLDKTLEIYELFSAEISKENPNER